MKRLLIILLLFNQILKAQEAEKLSLFDCIKLARENHPYFSDKDRIKENTDLKIKSANSQWLPQLNANGQATYQSDAININLPISGKLQNGRDTMFQKNIKTSQDQYKVYLDVNQMLYDGGSISAQKNITQASSEVDLLQNETDLHKINEQVEQVYFGLILFNQNLKLLESVKTTLRERQKTIESGFKNGILQQSDLDNITIELLRNQQQIDEFQISYSSNIQILSELTGKKLNDSLRIEQPNIELADTDSFQRAELKAFDAQKTILNFSDNLLKSQRLPRFYAFGQGGYGRPGLNMLSNDFTAYYIVGVTFKWNIWDFNKTSNDRQSLMIQSDLVESKKVALELNLRISIDNSLARMAQLKKSLASDSVITKLRSEVTKRSSVKLEKGVITATDYINDLNAEIQSKIQMQTHQVQWVQEKVNYFTIKGNL